MQTIHSRRRVELLRALCVATVLLYWAMGFSSHGQVSDQAGSGDSEVKAGSDDTEALAKAAQNPVGNLISVAFQNNFNHGIGPNDVTLNYNFPHGFYLTTAPIITANWKADSDNRWVVPVGGGFGKIVKLGRLPLNLQLSAYDNVVTPNYLAPTGNCASNCRSSCRSRSSDAQPSCLCSI